MYLNATFMFVHLNRSKQYRTLSDICSFPWATDGQYKLLAAPIKAVPISYRPAEPIRQQKRSFELTRQEKGPHPLVHATALACGARIVPLEEAASLIKAIESKIRSGGAKLTRLPSSSLTRLVPESVSMSSSSEDGQNDHSEPPAVNVEGYCHDDQISEEIKVQGEASELETDSENCSEHENHDTADC